MPRGTFLIRRTSLPGAEAVEADSDHTFPKHTHDQFGIAHAAGVPSDYRRLIVEHQEKFAAFLLSDETLLWAGKAGGGLLLTGEDVFTIPFSILWCSFVFAIWISALRAPAGPRAQYNATMMLLFLVVGLYLLFGRFFIDAYARNRTFYALTDRRLIILRQMSKRLGGGLRSFQWSDLPPARFKGSSEARGTVHLCMKDRPHPRLAARMPSFDGAVRLLKIENPQRVFTLAQELQRKASSVKA